MTKDMRDFVASTDQEDPTALIRALKHAYPSSSFDERWAALDAVARGAYCPASVCAAAALCLLTGLGDPLVTADRLYNQSNTELTEPQWFLWIAGYSYNWICNSGLSAVYADFGDEQFADRIRVYEAIGAETAARVMRAADAAFGPSGPPTDPDERRVPRAVGPRLDALSPQFWACGDEIMTRAFLYALAHSRDFAERPGG